MTAINRLTNCTFSTPPVLVDSGSHCRFANTVSPLPLSHRGGFSKRLKESITSAVVCLLGLRGPSNVPSLVMSINIDTVKRMFAGRAFTNVSDKFTNRLKPELDSATAISEESGIVRILTPAFSCVVGDEFRRGNAKDRKPVSSTSFSGHFSPQTSTGFGQASADGLPVNFPNSSAVTTTKPCSGTVFRLTRETEYVPTTNPNVGKVYDRFLAIIHNHILTHRDRRFITIF